MARRTLSACIITQDEEARLPAALRSLAFCDEVIVVDSGSTDRTREIARDAGAVVIENPWPGFGAQRNVAIDHAHGDWVVEVDADERISSTLASNILSFLAMPPPDDVDICVLPLRDRLLGRSLGPSAKYPRYRPRMFRRGTYRHDESRMVHEGLTAKGRVWAMKGDMDHELADSWSEALGDVWRYARLESGQVERLGSPLSYAQAIVLRPVAKLVYRLVVDGGWRDGPLGVARIGFDVSSDVIVWTRRALGMVPPRLSGSPSHFGRSGVLTGPVRVIGLASGAEDRDRAVAWLAAARAVGADVALITNVPTDGGNWLDVRETDPRRPLHLTRTLDALSQMRQIDALFVVGRPTRSLRLVPAHLRGAHHMLALHDDPATSVRALHSTLRRTT
ncbi:MAG: glycosyltransferase family 2 protein [Dehalococcoidia bacterium]